ncbi:hypothetical protein, partial [Rhodosalinus sp.]|uniref:hypothetical protein n=1 Tax=Rhodosalinus sp. TaxID=2047741 RepID=UPI0035687B97
IIEKSGKYVEIQEPISYGRAAKLVNAYLKALYLSQFGASDPTRSARANAIHPPIDNVLLSSLKIHDPDETRRKAWSRFHKKRWTKFQERDYLEVIALVTELTNGKRWMAEAYWRGYQ